MVAIAQAEWEEQTASHGSDLEVKHSVTAALCRAHLSRYLITILPYFLLLSPHRQTLPPCRHLPILLLHHLRGSRTTSPGRRQNLLLSHSNRIGTQCPSIMIVLVLDLYQIIKRRIIQVSEGALRRDFGQAAFVQSSRVNHIY